MTNMFNHALNNNITTGTTATDSSYLPNSVTYSTLSTDTSIAIRYYEDCDSTQYHETKKQRITRIAKEKMFASWKTHNQKTEKINKIIQVCKPKHKLSHMGRRSC
jgi:hypothetical protein